MVNIARCAGQQEVRAAQFTIHRGSRAARSSGGIHFYREHAIGRDAAEAVMRVGRCRNSWSRELENPGFLFGFSIV
jgi:hypothetical protein